MYILRVLRLICNYLRAFGLISFSFQRVRSDYPTKDLYFTNAIVRGFHGVLAVATVCYVPTMLIESSADKIALMKGVCYSAFILFSQIALQVQATKGQNQLLYLMKKIVGLNCELKKLHVFPNYGALKRIFAAFISLEVVFPTAMMIFQFFRMRTSVRLKLLSALIILDVYLLQGILSSQYVPYILTSSRALQALYEHLKSKPQTAFTISNTAGLYDTIFEIVRGASYLLCPQMLIFLSYCFMVTVFEFHTTITRSNHHLCDGPCNFLNNLWVAILIMRLIIYVLLAMDLKRAVSKPKYSNLIFSCRLS